MSMSYAEVTTIVHQAGIVCDKNLDSAMQKSDRVWDSNIGDFSPEQHHASDLLLTCMIMSC